MRMFAASLIVAASVLVGCAPSGSSFRGTEYEAPVLVADFILTDHQGLPFKLSDHDGAIVLLFFGYTHCPDVCPVTLSTWTEVERLLADDAGQVRFVFVTVDPERDSLERLRAHMAIFSRQFIGLGGGIEELEPVYELFGVSHEKIKVSTSAVGYLVDHSSTAFLIDPQGRLRLKYEFDAPSEDIVHDIRRLLKSAPRP
jgi:protein SCO1/2